MNTENVLSGENGRDSNVKSYNRNKCAFKSIFHHQQKKKVDNDET